MVQKSGKSEGSNVSHALGTFKCKTARGLAIISIDYTLIFHVVINTQPSRYNLNYHQKTFEFSQLIGAKRFSLRFEKIKADKLFTYVCRRVSWNLKWCLVSASQSESENSKENSEKTLVQNENKIFRSVCCCSVTVESAYTRSWKALEWNRRV